MPRSSVFRRSALFILTTGVVALLVAGTLIWQFDRLMIGRAKAAQLDRVDRQARVLSVISSMRPTPHPTDPAADAFDLAAAGLARGMDFAAFQQTGRTYLAWRGVRGIGFRELSARRKAFGPLREEPALPDSPLALGLSGQTGATTWRDPDGAVVLAAYAPVRGEALALVVAVSMAELREPLLRASVLTLALAALLILVVSGFYVWLTSGIERSLDAQQRLLRSIMDAIPHRLFVKDLERRYVLVNQAYATGRGAAPEQFVGRRSADTGLFDAAEAALIEELDMAALARGEPDTLPEVRIQAGDGIGRIYRITHAPVRSSRGQMTQFVGLMEDITAVVEAQRAAERAQADSERRYRILFSHVPVGIYELDTGGNCLIVNDRITAITGLNRAQALGHGWEAALHPDDRERVRRFAAEVMKSERPITSEFRILAPEGRVVWVESHALALRDGQGRVSGYLGALSDLTRRKRAESAQVQSYNLMGVVSRAQSHYIADTPPLDIFSRSLEDALLITGSTHGLVGEVRETAGTFPAQGGPEGPELAWETMLREGKPLPEEDKALLEPLRTLVGRVRATGRPALLALPEADAPAPGAPRTFAAVPIFHGKRMVAVVGLAGRPEGYGDDLIRFLDPVFVTYGAIIQAIRNDRRRREAEAAIIEKSQQLEGIFTNMAEGIVMLDGAGRIVQVNRQTRSMLEWADIPPHEPEDLETLLGFRLPDGRPCPREQLAMVRALREGQTIIGQQVSLERPWGEVALLVSAAPLFDGYRKVSGAVAILSDITELKKLDQLKSEFMSTVSHELRTPLAAILGYVQLILGGDAGTVSPDQQKYLEIVSRNTVRLTQLIGDLLDIEKIESGKTKLVRAAVNLTDLLLETASTFTIVAKQKGLRLLTRIAGNLVIVGEEDRLTQVFSNLLSNAVKYTRAGEVRLEAERLGDEVRVTVADTGIGLTPGDLGKLFTKFHRADDEYAREAGGTGLGLVISRAIIAQHAGRIEVSSVHGRGSEFRVYLPATLILNASAVPEPDRPGDVEDAAG